MKTYTISAKTQGALSRPVYFVESEGRKGEYFRRMADYRLMNLKETVFRRKEPQGQSSLEKRETALSRLRMLTSKISKSIMATKWKWLLMDTT